MISRSTHSFFWFRLLPCSTLYTASRSAAGFFLVQTWVFLNDEFDQAASTASWFYPDGDKVILAFTSRTTYDRMPDDGDVFVQAIQKTYQDFGVPPEGQVEFPFLTSCINYPTCPSDEVYCTRDPECSPTTFVEPDATIKAGPIVGIVCGVFAVILVALFIAHRMVLKRQADRFKSVFAARIADSIGTKPGQLTAEELQEEFNKIDSGENDGGDGAVSKDELWQFMKSGKAGDGMSQKDFNALFVAIDTDGSGQIDFMEFCAFMGQVQGRAQTKNEATIKKDVEEQAMPAASEKTVYDDAHAA